MNEYRDHQYFAGFDWLECDGLTATQTVAECLQRKYITAGTVVIVNESGQIAGLQMFDLVQLVRDGKAD